MDYLSQRVATEILAEMSVNVFKRRRDPLRAAHQLQAAGLHRRFARKQREKLKAERFAPKDVLQRRRFISDEFTHLFVDVAEFLRERLANDVGRAHERKDVD